MRKRKVLDQAKEWQLWRDDEERILWRSLKSRRGRRKPEAGSIPEVWEESVSSSFYTQVDQGGLEVVLGNKEDTGPSFNPYGGGKWITSTWETAEVVASSRENHVLIKARWYTFRESEKREGVPLLQKGFPEDIAVSLEKMPREAWRCVYRTVVCLEWPIHCATGFLTYQQDKSTMSLHDDNIQTYMW